MLCKYSLGCLSQINRMSVQLRKVTKLVENIQNQSVTFYTFARSTNVEFVFSILICFLHTLIVSIYENENKLKNNKIKLLCSSLYG